MIRQARTDEANILTDISFLSKNYWNYPQEYLEAWKKELTITEEYIERNDVYVYEHNEKIIGYYSVVELQNQIEVSGIEIEKGIWLEHMFFIPESICQGFGGRMFSHIIEKLKGRDMEKLRILADPHSRGFYEKMGCRYIKDYPSTIQNRTTPYLEYEL